MSNEFWAAVGGAIVGSVVGGLISFFLQFWAFRHAAEERQTASRERRDERAAEKLEREQALAFSLFIKAQRIADNFRSFARWVIEAYEKVQDAEPWQFLLPLMNAPPTVHFTPDELAVVLPRDAPLFNDLVILDETHNSTIVVVNEYKSQRADLHALLRPIAMDGAVGTLAMTPDDFPLIRPRMVEVNMIAASLRATVSDDAEKALALTHRLLVMCHEKLLMKLRAKPAADASLPGLPDAN